MMSVTYLEMHQNIDSEADCIFQQHFLSHLLLYDHCNRDNCATPLSRHAVQFPTP